MDDEGWGREEARREVGGTVGCAACFMECGAGSIKDAVRASRTGIAEQDPVRTEAGEARLGGRGRSGLEGGGAIEGTPEVFDGAVGAVLPNDMDGISVDGHVGMAVGAGKGLAERNSHVDQTTWEVAVGSNRQLDFVAALILFPCDDRVGEADSDVGLVLIGV